MNQIPGACNGTCGQDGNFEVVAVKISPSDQGQVSMQPDGLSFAPEPVGTRSKMEHITLTNSGQAPLSVSKIGLAGSDRGDFAEINNCPLSPRTLAPGGNCTIDVAFDPHKTGRMEATVGVVDNGPGSPQKASLKGMAMMGSSAEGANPSP